MLAMLILVPSTSICHSKPRIHASPKSSNLEHNLDEGYPAFISFIFDGHFSFNSLFFVNSFVTRSISIFSSAI